MVPSNCMGSIPQVVDGDVMQISVSGDACVLIRRDPKKKNSFGSPI